LRTSRRRASDHGPRRAAAPSSGTAVVASSAVSYFTQAWSIMKSPVTDGLNW
jgi:hypothetical protein